MDELFFLNRRGSKAKSMSTTLHPLIRYRTLDQCFRQKGVKWNYQALCKACGEQLRELIRSDLPDPSRRTIMGDIERMRNGQLGYRAPITYHRGGRGYYYSDPDFSITHASLSPVDLEALHQSVSILKQFRGFDQVLDVEETIQKLEYALQPKDQLKGPLIQFDRMTGHQWQRWLSLLLPHIKDQQCLRMQYQPFNDEPRWVTFSPYLLKEYNRRWYVIGWRHEKKRVENLALDRLKDITISIQPFCKVETFNANDYYQNIVGVTIHADQRLSNVRILALPSQTHYIATKPIHPSQQVESTTEAGTIFSYELIPNFELESLLLSFGDRIKVLEPQILVERMKTRLQQAANHYDVKG